MPVDAIEKDCRTTMEKCVSYLKDELRGIRTGRASPGLVEHLKVPVQSYGSTMILRELATISAPDPVTVLIKPFDPSTLKDIEKALRTSDIGITPASDGKIIRLPIPPLSGERRGQLVSQVKQMGESQKVGIRNVRRDANKQIDAIQKDGTLSEDEAKNAKDRVQKLTRKYEEAVDSVVAAKGKELEEA
ncbi:MAG TPA: ribosome recycling factor [Phycisphaerae bacterium]|nr:ribosome recycling factor [Phycisphaerae bacterium]